MQSISLNSKHRYKFVNTEQGWPSFLLQNGNYRMKRIYLKTRIKMARYFLAITLVWISCAYMSIGKINMSANLILLSLIFLLYLWENFFIPNPISEQQSIFTDFLGISKESSRLIRLISSLIGFITILWFIGFELSALLDRLL
jgi:hypothetical protein